MRVPCPTLLVLAVLASAPARADPPWAVVDLGHLRLEAHCMEAARASFLRAQIMFGARALRESSWVVFADGLGGTDDALIACTFGDNRGARATLAIHGRGAYARTITMAQSIRTHFEALNSEITAEWLAEITGR